MAPKIYWLIGILISSSILAPRGYCTEDDGCQWMTKAQLESKWNPGDMIALRNNSESEARRVIYVGNNRVVYQASHNTENKLLLGTVDNLIGTEGQGCIDNKHYKILDNVEPDTNVTAIIQRALGEVGRAFTTSAAAGEDGGSLPKEEQLGLYARYGNQNKTWIEEMVGKSSLALEEGIGQSSLQISKEITKMFGQFVDKLVKTSAASFGKSVGAAGKSMGSVGTSLASGSG